MNEIEYLAASIADTERLGQALAQVLPAGSTVALHGTLGAGKTRLVQAVATACGIDPGDVLSPTFVLCHEYRGGRRPIYHFDVYRVADDDEFLELGPDEYFESDGITFVEWAERVDACLPRQRWEISIESVGDTSRLFRIAVSENEMAELLRRLEQQLRQAERN